MSRSFGGPVLRAGVVASLAVLPATWSSAPPVTPVAGPAPETVTAAAASLPLPGRRPGPSARPAAPAMVPAATVAASTGLPKPVAVPDETAQDIPAPALAAYQRAEVVINAADPSCHLSWELLAGIGRVESGHGTYAGNVLDAKGVARPGIYGIALDGSRGTQRIADTDAGVYDHDRGFDRAVGPMQFIPSTWSVIGVDADNDGVRNPQDIDDAALSSAVYLCSGRENLATVAGQRSAVFSYNHSQQYVDLVLGIAAAYSAGTLPDAQLPFTFGPPTATRIGPIPPVAPSQPGSVHARPTGSLPAPAPVRLHGVQVITGAPQLGSVVVTVPTLVGEPQIAVVGDVVSVRPRPDHPQADQAHGDQSPAHQPKPADPRPVQSPKPEPRPAADAPTEPTPTETTPPEATPTETTPTQEPTPTEPAPTTEPPAPTEPPPTEPPATEPPATEPPATEPPATEPPAPEPVMASAGAWTAAANSLCAADADPAGCADQVIAAAGGPSGYAGLTWADASSRLCSAAGRAGDPSCTAGIETLGG